MEGDLAGSGQPNAKIAFELSLDDLALEDHQRSTSDMAGWWLASSDGSFERFLRFLCPHALSPLEITLALDDELLEAVADPVDQTALEAGGREPTIAGNRVGFSLLESRQFDPNRRRDDSEKMHRHR